MNNTFEYSAHHGANQFYMSVFKWMFIGLLITFGVAFAISNSMSAILFIYGNAWMPLVLFVAQIGVVIAMGARLLKMQPSTVKALFLAYSVLTGVTFSSIFIVYTASSIAGAFLISSIYFGSLAIIGYTTKTDLSKLGTLCAVALLVLIVVEFIFLLMGASTDTLIFNAIGLLIFTGLTAWDVQKMKKLYSQFSNDENMLQNIGVYSALDLYLDFINIFLYILRFLGKNRD